jgi:GNAT superfamily N-acetyltransferase
MRAVPLFSVSVLQGSRKQKRGHELESLLFRPLARDELGLVWTIDRRELIETIYRLEDGELVLRPDPLDVRGWPPAEAEQYTARHEACHDRGGTFLGAFDGDRLVGVAVLDTLPLGAQRDQLQLTFLHVSRDYRGQGLGARLFEEMRKLAHAQGARYLYVSATPSENTVRFYQRRGCIVAPEPDPELLALEPEDIHFICPV